ncbi:MAG: hypothetical protein ABFS56_08825 [Pseudomonadota bacterium]
MSTDYYASFTPVPLTRQALQTPLEKLFSEMSAQLDADCYRLELKNGQFEYTDEEITCESLIDALIKTHNWGGVEINLVYERKLCSLIIANEIPDKTMVVFCVPESLFEKQWVNPLNRFNLLNLLVNFMKRLGASFCVLEPGWARRSRTSEDIEKWLRDVNQGIARDWELVIIQDLFISRKAVPNFAKTYFLETLPKPNMLSLSSIREREPFPSLSR